MTYVANPNNREIVSRLYKVGRDGGAQKWQLQYSKDQEYNTDTIDVSGDDGVYVPEQWLNPLYISALPTKPSVVQKESDEPGLTTVILTEEYPCPTDMPVTETLKQLGVEGCKPGQEKTVSTRKITYTTEHLIPMKLIDANDGVQFHTITVEHLKFK